METVKYRRDKTLLSENAKTVLARRYLKKDKDGNVVETPQEMFRRVANNIAQADRIYNPDIDTGPIENEFYDVISNLEFLPNSPTLMNAGRDLQQLSACFVLPIEDSMESIFETIKDQAMIHKSGGGTGFSFSRLRPKNSMVKTTGGIASGPVSFLKVFDAATQAVKQGGCVTPSTRISTGKGLVKIKELGPVDAKPNTWHKYNPHHVKVFTDDGIKISNEFYNNGISETLKLTTRNGYSVSATPEHRLRIIDENGDYVWRYIKDIKVGDWVALQKDTCAEKTQYRFPEFKEEMHFNATKISIPSRPSKELGEFVGLLIGDGAISINKKGCGRLIISIADKDADVANYLLKISEELFRLKPTVQKKANDKSTNYFFNSNMLIRWLRCIGVEKPSASRVYVPELAFKAGREFASGFLRGLFTADGSVTKEGYVSLCSISKTLIEEVQQLLLSLGIPSAIFVNKKPRKNSFGGSPLYRLRIITNAGLIKFAQEIGFISKKKNSYLKHGFVKAWEFNDIVPNIEYKIKSLYNGPGRGCGPGRSKRGANRSLYRDIQHYLPEVDAPRHLTRSRLNKLADKHREFKRDPYIIWFLNNNQFYDQIADIETGKSVTLDLAVPENNTYIANGFVSHNTRRGANMGILRVDHPDILEFIKCKESDKDITNFNISVAITDDFMERVKKRQDYDLIEPHTGRAAGKLNAKEVFDLIVEKAWRNGEPGIIFIDTINKENPTPKAGVIESTNPCVTSDTWVMTAEGPRQVRDLAGKKFTAVVNGERWQSADKGFFETGIKDVYRLRTREGHELCLTKNHPVRKVIKKTRYKIDSKWVDAGSLKPNDRIIVNNHNGLAGWEGKYTEEQGYLIGMLLGDGTIKKDKPILSSWGDNQAAKTLRGLVHNYADALPHRADFNGWCAIRDRGEYRLTTAGLKELSEELGLSYGRKIITKEIEQASSDFYRGFLRGFFDADGSVQGSQSKGISIRLAQSDIGILKAVQRMLLRLGIFSRIYSNRRDKGISILPDGKGGLKEYSIKAQHELIISSKNIWYFFRKIGFSDSDKMGRLRELIENYQRSFNRERFIATVEDVAFEEEKTVYDTRIPGINAFDANGFYVHNCGEQILLPYESCNLGSINLSKMVRSDNGLPSVDWDRLKSTVHTAVHFLDNVIDMNKFPLEKIEEVTKDNRKIGLGVMGWADMLVQLGVAYNSEDAVGLAREVISFIRSEAEKVSIEFAKTRGSFPNWDESVYAEGGTEPMRNATLTTIAPAGTISIIANASSGIEPIFAVSYYRKVMDNDRLIEVHPIFKRISQERGFYSDELMKKIAEKSSIQDVEEIPDDVRRIFATAHDISPIWHIRMQGAFQEFTDNAVSKTVNFPNGATVDDVEEVYMLAYKMKCKGVTIYRDGSRSEQVLNVGTPPKEEKEKRPLSPKPRPKVTSGTTTKITTGCGNLYITINDDDTGKPFEVFMQMGKAGGCAASQLEAVGRLVSLALRSGLEINTIVEQLQAIRCPTPSWEKGGRIFSCADAISKALEKRISAGISEINEGWKAPSVDAMDPPSMADMGGATGNVVGVCPDCGGALRHEEGCMICRACGYSKCG